MVVDGESHETAGLDVDAYLRATGESESDLARRAGVSQQHVNRIRRGLRLPRPKIAEKLIAASSGRITHAALYRRAPAAGEAA